MNQNTKACSTANACQAEIDALEREVAEYLKKSDTLNKQAMSLQSNIALLSNQKAIIQAKLDIAQAKYNKLQKQISDTEKKIKDNKDALGRIIADLYVDDKITPIEMLASSNTISDYLDKQEYRSSVRSELTSTINEIKALKLDLEKKRDEVSDVLKEQKSQRDSLAAKEAEQNSLLSATRGQESVYQQLIGKNQEAIAMARAIQASLSQRSSNTGGYVLLASGFLSSYVTISRFGTWNDSNCRMGGYLPDVGWLPYVSNGGIDYSYNDMPPYSGQDGRGYGCRQCASYVAWKINQATGFYPSWGDARMFDDNAIAKFGYSENVPRAGSIAVMDEGSFGHVAWVESNPYTNSKGQTVIQVSQYNWDYGQGYGMYSVMELSPSVFDYYVQIVK